MAEVSFINNINGRNNGEETSRAFSAGEHPAPDLEEQRTEGGQTSDE